MVRNGPRHHDCRSTVVAVNGADVPGFFPASDNDSVSSPTSAYGRATRTLMDESRAETVSWCASRGKFTPEESETLLPESAAGHERELAVSSRRQSARMASVRMPGASPLLWEEEMGASHGYQYSRWCLVVGTVVVFAAVMGAVIPGMTAEQNLKRRATAVVLPTTTLSPVVALLSGKYTTTTAAAVITSDPQSTMPAAEGPTAAHILQTPTGKLRIDGNIIKKGKDSEARESTPNEKFDPEGEICNAKLAKPAIEPSRRWELDPSWMTLCHVNDHEHSFPNLERNWCWVGFKTQCHQTGKGHDQSWAAVQDFAYKAGRVPPPD